MFGVESLAIEYCDQYRIPDNEEQRTPIVNAFVVGFGFGHKANTALIERLEEEVEALRQTARQWSKHGGVNGEIDAKLNHNFADKLQQIIDEAKAEEG